jgi:hypothetical protein
MPLDPPVTTTWASCHVSTRGRLGCRSSGNTELLNWSWVTTAR